VRRRKTWPFPTFSSVDDEYERCMSGNVTRSRHRFDRENVRNPSPYSSQSSSSDSAKTTKRPK